MGIAQVCSSKLKHYKWNYLLYQQVTNNFSSQETIERQICAHCIKGKNWIAEPSYNLWQASSTHRVNTSMLDETTEALCHVLRGVTAEGKSFNKTTGVEWTSSRERTSSKIENQGRSTAMCEVMWTEKWERTLLLKKNITKAIWSITDIWHILCICAEKYTLDHTHHTHSNHTQAPDIQQYFLTLFMRSRDLDHHMRSLNKIKAWGLEQSMIQGDQCQLT